MTLDQISTKILARLAYEAGSNEWWTAAEIKTYINSLYSEMATVADLIRKRTAAIATIASTAEYNIPKTTEVRTIKKVYNIDYDGEPLDYVSISELNANLYKWRNLADGIPFGWFYEAGNENKTFSLVPAPATADLNMYADISFVPNDLGDSDSPAEPFADGIVLFDGTMSICLGKAGGGRDLDRSDWYWMQFISKVPSLSREKVTRTHVMRGIDSGVGRQGFRLGEHYPIYTID